MAEVNEVGKNPTTPQDTTSTGKPSVPEKIIIVPLNGQGEFSATVTNRKDFGNSIFNGTVAGKENTMCIKMPDSDKYHCEGFDTPNAAEEKGLQAVKLDIPTKAPGKFEEGADFNQTIQALFTDNSLTQPFPETKPGATYSATKLYKGGALSDDGNSVKGGKLVATVIQDGDQRYIVDAKGHKFSADEDGKIVKE